jgi:hypothetical protein
VVRFVNFAFGYCCFRLATVITKIRVVKYLTAY